MKNRIKTLLAAGLFAVAASMWAPGSLAAETIKKLHSSPNLIINSTAFNDTNEPTSNTVDLSGGDLDKASFAVVCSSAAGSTTMSLAIQISPDGGTNWVATGDTITVSTSATLGAAVSAYSANKTTAPGTKMRVVPTLTGSTTFYNFKLYTIPSVD